MTAVHWVNTIPGVKPSDQFIALDRRLFEDCIARVLSAVPASPIPTSVANEREREDEDRTADEAVDFVFDLLARKLGLAEWQVVEGSEEWEGDVSATLYRLLVDAGIIDDETGAIAALSPALDNTDGKRTIEILSRALAWHGDPQRMATTREEWQQTIDTAIAWVKANPEPGRVSFSSFANASPALDNTAVEGQS